jgi:protein-S-isoprenylcysteine O-methyltransferase Ste14
MSAPQPTNHPSDSPARPGLGLEFALGIVALPAVVYYLWICMRYHGGALVLPTSRAELRELLREVPLPTFRAAAIYGTWVAAQLVLQIVAPGRWFPGAPLDDGSRLKYRLNGWFSWWLTLLVVLVLVWRRVIPATLLAHELGPILTVANLASIAFALYLYVFPWLHRQAKGPERRGGFFHDFFTGVVLNPRLGSLDLKFFCESRPGLILWVLIDLSLAAQQLELHGRITSPMLLVCIFHFFYVADYFLHEEAILSTWDIRHERFGFMLSWGCLVWVPFTFSLQAQYLVRHAHELSMPATVGIVALNAAGYFIFRSSNLQKHRFRQNPSAPIWGKRPTYLRTARGTQLLTAGFWGLARHLNYTGDLMMGLAWCLTCKFGHVLPYFYFIYFSILLIHRERRDDQHCAARYGTDWDEYRRRVPWRMIPGVY